MAEPRAIVPEYGVRPGLNNTGTALEKGVVVALGTSQQEITLPAAQTDICYGVTMEAIADGERGDVQVEGVALVQASGALATPGVELEPETDGEVSEHGGSNTKIGLLLSTAAAAGDLVEVELYKRKTP
jgi:predicted RecA/RadA family phage recombinase